MCLKLVFSLCFVLPAVLSIKSWNDLRIRFAKDETDGFFPVGRTFSKVLKQGGWKATEPLTCVGRTDSGEFHGYQVINTETSVAMLYDVKGVIAGMQALLPHKEMLVPGSKFRFDSIPMFQNTTLNGQKYFILTVYFVPPERICENGRAEIFMEKDGTGQGLWLQYGSDPVFSTVEVPMKESRAAAEGWRMHNCFPRMGWHSFYLVEKMQEKDCLENFPIMLLYDNQFEIIGFGYRIFGKPTGSIFEYPKNATIRVIVKEPVPECLLKQNHVVGTASIHIYFTQQPWLIKCPNQ